MDENILVVKKKDNLLKLKITKRKRNQYSNPQYSKVLNPNNANDLALFMGDLNIIFNAPIKRAFEIFKQDSDDLKDAFFLWNK